jgi:DNA-directed RNA polymerase specialized sigma24 family protein
VAATSPQPVDVSYEDFVRLHAEQFTAYLRGMLGRQAEGRGGRVAVDDTLQEALLQIYAEWPDLQHAGDGERDERMYRCLRDAAGQALRAEHGRRTEGSARPRIVPFDFGSMHVSADEQPAHERELTAAVLGAMVRDMAAAERDRDARSTLDRGILVAGLRALTEREAVILIAADHLGWDQVQLAEHLDIEFRLLRATLFEARKVFYALVRHATGVEIEDHERARLAAYLAGELTGAEKREARRHLQHCRACQDLQREQRVFGRDAHGVLAPLPFIFGAKVLAKRFTVKGATLGGGAGAGLFAQAGAAKATAIVVGLLSVGVATSAWLARDADQPHHRGVAPAAGYLAPASGMTRITVAPAPATKHNTSGPSRRPSHARHKSHRAASSTGSTSNATTTSAATQSATPTQSSKQGATQQPPASNPTSTKKSSGSGGGGAEFFGG